MLSLIVVKCFIYYNYNKRDNNRQQCGNSLRYITRVNFARVQGREMVYIVTRRLILIQAICIVHFSCTWRDRG